MADCKRENRKASLLENVTGYPGPALLTSTAAPNGFSPLPSITAMDLREGKITNFPRASPKEGDVCTISG